MSPFHAPPPPPPGTGFRVGPEPGEGDGGDGGDPRLEARAFLTSLIVETRALRESIDRLTVVVAHASGLKAAGRGAPKQGETLVDALFRKAVEAILGRRG